MDELNINNKIFKNFKKIGEYVIPGEPPLYKEFIGRNKSKVFPLVYLLVVDGHIKYIGETRRGYARPLNYHKNDIMKTQKEAIWQKTKEGLKVEVYGTEIKSKVIKINDIDIECYLAQDYEKYLIQTFRPEWNGRK